MRTYNTLFAGTSGSDLVEDDHFNLVKHGSVRLAMN